MRPVGLTVNCLSLGGAPALTHALHSETVKGAAEVIAPLGLKVMAPKPAFEISV